MNNIPNIALVGNAPQDKIDILNALLGEEDLTDVCDITLYGADGQQDIEALEDAIEDYRDGQIQGIACLPLTQPVDSVINEYLDETPAIAVSNNANILAQVCDTQELSEAAMSLKTEMICNKATALSKMLKRDLNITTPRIAVLSLNDSISNGDNSEEENIIAPAIKKLAQDGIQAFGPYNYKTFFYSADSDAFDAVLQIYDGQCNEAFGNISNEGMITLFGNISIPITQSEPEDIIKAIFIAASIHKARAVYDIPFANPLPKLYHERKEDGDKARFAVKKKGFNPAEHRRENINFKTAKDQPNKE